MVFGLDKMVRGQAISSLDMCKNSKTKIQTSGQEWCSGMKLSSKLRIGVNWTALCQSTLRMNCNRCLILKKCFMDVSDELNDSYTVLWIIDYKFIITFDCDKVGCFSVQRRIFDIWAVRILIEGKANCSLLSASWWCRKISPVSLTVALLIQEFCYVLGSNWTMLAQTVVQF